MNATPILAALGLGLVDGGLALIGDFRGYGRGKSRTATNRRHRPETLEQRRNRKRDQRRHKNRGRR